MSLPKISVIMSVYNGMPYLKDAVKSILNQTFKNFEFIIVDDASTDNSWNYLKSLKDKQSLRSSQVAGLKRIKLIKNKRNLGLAASLNKRFENQVKFMLQNTQIDICGTWADLIDETGEVIGEKKFPQKHVAIIKSLIDRKSTRLNS